MCPGSVLLVDALLGLFRVQIRSPFALVYDDVIPFKSLFVSQTFFFCILFLMVLRQDLCVYRLCSITGLIMSQASIYWHSSHFISAGV